MTEQLAEPAKQSRQEPASAQGPHEVGGPGALPVGTATENSGSGQVWPCTARLEPGGRAIRHQRPKKESGCSPNRRVSCCDADCRHVPAGQVSPHPTQALPQRSAKSGGRTRAQGSELDQERRPLSSRAPRLPQDSSKPPGETTQPLPVRWGDAGGRHEVLTERRQQEVHDLREERSQGRKRTSQRFHPGRTGPQWS